MSETDSDHKRQVWLQIFKANAVNSSDWMFLFFKVLTQNIFNKDGPSVLTRIYTLFSEKAEQTDKAVSYSVSDLLMLLIYAYSLVGEECFYGTEEEDRVKVICL